MTISRWKVMAGVLGVSIGGLAAFAGQCPKPGDAHRTSRADDAPKVPADAPKLPPAGSGPMIPIAPAAAADALPPLPAPATKAPDLLPPAPVKPVVLPDVPAPADLKPALPLPKADLTPASALVPAIPGAPPAATPTGPAPPAPMIPDAVKPTTTPPPPGAAIPTTPPVTAETPPAINFTPSTPPTTPGTGPASPPPADPLVSPPARQQRAPELAPDRPPAAAPAAAPAATKFRIILRVGEGEPTFEVRQGDDLMMKVVCEKVDIKSPEKGSGPSAVTASGKVRFVGFGAEGTCDQLSFMAGTGEVTMHGAVKIQVKDKLGRVESELTADKMHYRLDAGSLPGGGIR